MFNDSPISREIVMTCIFKLPSKCNSSLDGVPKGMLNYCCYYVMNFINLNQLFLQIILDEGHIPTMFNVLFQY